MERSKRNHWVLHRLWRPAFVSGAHRPRSLQSDWPAHCHIAALYMYIAKLPIATLYTHNVVHLQHTLA